MLRTWNDADVDQIFDACQDPLIQQYIPLPRPYARHDAMAYVERTERQWADGSKAAFAIADGARPEVVLGAINVAVFESVGNIAYWVAPLARHRGVAATALRLIAHWAFHELGLGVLLLEIRPENAWSLRVGRDAGFLDVGQIDVNDQTGERHGHILVRLASDET